MTFGPATPTSSPKTYESRDVQLCSAISQQEMKYEVKWFMRLGMVSSTKYSDFVIAELEVMTSTGSETLKLSSFKRRPSMMRHFERKHWGS